MLLDLLRSKDVEGIKRSWDASPEAITVAAEWFFPCLERFVWGLSGMADGYVIEGVDFLPEHVTKLSTRFLVRSVFLGCLQMTPERFDRFPGHSPGYTFLPEDERRQFAGDIPKWSAFMKQMAEREGCPYLDMSEDFPSRLDQAETILVSQ